MATDRGFKSVSSVPETQSNDDVEAKTIGLWVGLAGAEGSRWLTKLTDEATGVNGATLTQIEALPQFSNLNLFGLGYYA